MDPSMTQVKRELRSVWQSEENELAYEAAVYAKRRIGFKDYLINIANSKHLISIDLKTSMLNGYITELGRDYFTVRRTNSDEIHVFYLEDASKHEASFRRDLQISESKYENGFFQLSDNSFRSKLGTFSEEKSELICNTKSDKQYMGLIELYKDFIVLSSNTSYDTSQRLVAPLTQVIPISNIESIVIKY